MQNNIKTILIVGGGTAGWMTAAALARFLPPSFCSIRLVESEQIGTVGVGEATIPHIRQFNNMLGIDENEFIRATQATYKLGISFENWGRIGEAYLHPFGGHGHDISGIEFHHYWLRMRDEGKIDPIDQFSMAAVAALANKFDYPTPNPDSVLSTYSYAFHIDASRYASFLRTYAENKGVIRTEGKVVNVLQRETGGFIQQLALDSGEKIDADLFIDCSGFRGLLIEETLKTGYENWSHWLPCDRAVAVPCERSGEFSAYTRAIARSAGWQWRIPLQHRTGNGYVYSSEHISDEDALATLLTNLDGQPLAEPNLLRFQTGRRKQSWSRNCVAIGLSSGFLEPLESTSIYLIQVGILKLMEFFPNRRFRQENIDEFNRIIALETQRIRDFLILHYNVTRRDDSEFWNYCRTMNIPNELAKKKALFEESAQVERYQYGLFMTPSWIAVYLGQGFFPKDYDARVKSFDALHIQRYLEKMRGELQQATDTMPSASTAISRAVNGIVQAYPTASLSLYGVR